MKVCYDLHIHSCLSPCGDDDMTPNNIVNMARLAGLDFIALTDHNSCKNCPAFIQAAQRAGIKAAAGMELCTAEECHVVCLFPKLESAMEFDAYVESRLPKIKNDPDIYGTQTVMDSDDKITGYYPVLLANAASIGLEETAELVRKYGGAAFPSHIDRPSFSVTANLGTVPDAGFNAFEVTVRGNAAELIAEYPVMKGHPILCNSDAHMLGLIQERGPWLELDEPTPEALISALNGESNCKWGR